MLARAKANPTFKVTETVGRHGRAPEREAYDDTGALIGGHKKHRKSQTMDGVDTANDVLGTLASSGLDLADSVTAVGKAAWKTAVIDGAEGVLKDVPFVGGIVGIISSVVNIGLLIAKAVRMGTDKEAWNDNALDFAMDGIKTGMDTLQGIFGVIKNFPGIPIIGAVFGIIGGTIDLCMASFDFHKQRKALSSMTQQMGENRQKSASVKSASGQKEKMADSYTQRRWWHGSGALMRNKRVDDANVEQASAIEADEALLGETLVEVKDPGSSGSADEKKLYDAYKAKVERKKALETEESGENSIAKRKERLSGSREMDMMFEIRKANRNRMRRTGVAIGQGVVKIISAAASLDPTYGAAAGTAASLTASAVGWAQKGGNSARQLSRNQGAFGADTSKSNKGKKERRHRLAITMYDDLKTIDSYKLGAIADDSQHTPEQKTALMSHLVQFQKTSTRLTAMGVNQRDLQGITDPNAFVVALRKGFYREK